MDTVSVHALNDYFAEPTEYANLTHRAHSQDPDYEGLLLGEVQIVVEDNNVANVTASTPSLTLVEGGEVLSYTLSLTSRPLGDVHVTVVQQLSLATNGTKADFYVPGNDSYYSSWANNKNLKAQMHGQSDIKWRGGKMM